jgi:hypothetical protein
MTDLIPACCSGSNVLFESKSGGSIPSVGANFSSCGADRGSAK